MGSKWVMVLVLFMFVSLQGCLSQISGCWDEERVALLQLKHFFNDPNSLQDWVEGDWHNNSDCCQWENVECNISTGRVISLDLESARDGELREGYLNASLFSAFEQLEELDLSWNSIAGFVDNGGLDKLSRLRNLEYLDLGHNMLNNDILSSLNALPSLTSLYLYENRLNETVDLQGLDSCKNLMFLRLDDNQIEKVVFPKGLDNLSRLRNLEYLYLGHNMFNNDILSSLNVLPSLKYLDLWGNRLNETVDLQVLHSCQNLTYLDLSYNKIEKVAFPKGLDKLSTLTNLELLGLGGNMLNNGIFSSLNALPSLTFLYLDENRLNETVDLQGLHSCQNLIYLLLSDNQIEKVVLPRGLDSLRNLEYLSMGGNPIEKFISPKGSTGLRKLETLYLRGVNVINGSSLLQSLGSFPSLKTLYLTQSKFSDSTTIRGLCNSVHLQELYLSDNNLMGTLPSCFANLTSLRVLDVSSNLFQGHIPKEIGEYLPSLRSLNLSRNAFDGSIPSSIGDMNSLQSLDLSFNQLSGKIPDHLAEGCTSLELLVLSNNNIQGQIFSTNFHLTNLLRLQLDSNNFTGRIPDSLSKASKLAGLYLSDNKISGGIPSWLGNISSLEDIIMPNNHLEGPIPLEFCRLDKLEVLDLTGNNISGSLPSCFSPPSITQVHLSKNRLDGQLKEAFYNSSSLVTLDLGYNRLDGSIPTWIGRLTHLTYLTLSNNNFEGEVPTHLCKLKQLRLVDISHNNLYGHLPPCLDFTALHDSGSISIPPVDSPSMHPINGSTLLSMLPTTPLTLPTMPLTVPTMPLTLAMLLIMPLSTRLPMLPTSTPLLMIPPIPKYSPPMRKDETVEFRTKNNSYFYQGKVLTGMSGIDLSCNKLTGLIPQQIGNLTRIRTLNLSHNNFTGPIPPTFAKLRQIESLDLSYNNLNGEIPHQLVDLDSLSVFSVAHNNLSGNIPTSRHFCTYGDNGFDGNPFLYGLPLSKSCDGTKSPSPMPRAAMDNGEDNDLFDMDIFYISFTVSYIIVLLGIAAVLYINPYWRRSWFYLVETRMTSWYYFVVDNLPRRLRH